MAQQFQSVVRFGDNEAVIDFNATNVQGLINAIRQSPDLGIPASPLRVFAIDPSVDNHAPHLAPSLHIPDGGYPQLFVQAIAPPAAGDAGGQTSILAAPPAPIADDIDHRTVLIRVASQHNVYYIGTGIRIGGRLVFTVRHVAMPKEYVQNKAKAIRGDKTELTYEVGLHHPRPVWCKAISLGISEDFDLALLELSTHGSDKQAIEDIGTIGIPAQNTSLRLLGVCLCGYPKRRVNIFRTTQDITATQPPLPSIKLGYVSADTPDELEVNISGEEGYSGSALVFTQTGLLCGVLKDQSPENKQEFTCEPQHHIVPWVNRTLQDLVPSRPKLWNWE